MKKPAAALIPLASCEAVFMALCPCLQHCQLGVHSSVYTMTTTAFRELGELMEYMKQDYISSACRCKTILVPTPSQGASLLLTPPEFFELNALFQQALEELTVQQLLALFHQPDLYE